MYVKYCVVIHTPACCHVYVYCTYVRVIQENILSMKLLYYKAVQHTQEVLLQIRTCTYRTTVCTNYEDVLLSILFFRMSRGLVVGDFRSARESKNIGEHIRITIYPSMRTKERFAKATPAEKVQISTEK